MKKVNGSGITLKVQHTGPMARLQSAFADIGFEVRAISDVRELEDIDDDELGRGVKKRVGEMTISNDRGVPQYELHQFLHSNEF